MYKTTTPLAGAGSRPRPRGRRAIAGLIAGSLALLTACSSGGDQADAEGGESLDEVRIAYLGVASWLPAMVAEDQGYFEDEGIQIQSTIITNLATLPGAMGRQFDIASTTIPDVLNANENGIDVTAVAGEAWETEEKSVVRLLARPGSGIAELSDLEGKRVAAGTLGGNIHPATLYWLSQENLDISTIDFAEVPFPEQRAQMTAGVVDAVEALEPFASAMLADGAIDLGSPLLAVSDRISISSWMAAEQWADGNADVVDRFVAALESAKTFIKENEGDARAILQTYTELPEAVAANVQLPEFDFALPQSDIDAWRDVMEAAK
jgi:NitT/TauT family transport system substrate-binding protein